MEFSNVKETINELLGCGEKIAYRKNISLSLPSELVSRIDKVGELSSQICGKNISRQFIIESAIEAYLKDFQDIMATKFGIYSMADIPQEKMDFDTLIVPSHEDGMKVFFQNEWYWLRLGKDKIDKIKYLAIYTGAPISAITHYAKVEELKKYSQGYKAFLSDITELPHPIPLGSLNASYVRPNRYVTLSRLRAAKTYSDLVDFE